MDALKKFFDRKMSDTKFKKAGSGKSLATGSQGGSGSHSRQQPNRGPQQRHPPTQDARKAGAAALARFETNTKKTDVNWSMQAIKAQARKEMEAEKKAQEQQQHDAQALAGPREVHLEAAPMLAVKGVLFHCPLIGPEVAPYDDIKKHIREFLYSQIEEDAAISACLIIHTCNKNKEKVGVCIDTLCKYIDNIVSNPSDEKFRKIRQSNKAYQERIHPIEGTREFLSAAGFAEEELSFNDTNAKFWVFKNRGSDDLSNLEQLRDALVSAEPLKPQLDHSLAVLLPAHAASHTDLPPEFFNLTLEELKKEHQERTTAFERSQMLMTKVMRERMEIKELRKYRFSLIRVRFPDGLILQSTFGVREKFEEVLTLVRENLVNDWRPFFLNLSGGGRINESEQTLYDLKLVPAVMFNFEWDPSIQDPNLDDSVYLKPETPMLLQDPEH
ncbi:hypothetical protein Pmani_009094 [Petrolisthes manimaculis]|uniref:UBX domain-containing protein n=1 Tax=Petrolisthes manimaculis TaxID=1843537 RepID=A0AAE1Q509_9EUCA|nr:hypothetical protein Pmani_009094 [Petrolisthes manimaculis]